VRRDADATRVDNVVVVQCNIDEDQFHQDQTILLLYSFCICKANECFGMPCSMFNVVKSMFLEMSAICRTHLM